MGLFDKLFGSKLAGNGSGSTMEMMSEERFWNIIQHTHDRAGGDYEKQQEELTTFLIECVIEDVIAFDNRFRELRGKANHWDLWGAAYIINGGCSDDAFNDFRGWLICQGETIYTRVVSYPEALVELEPERINIDWEGAGYISFTVYEDRVGRPIPTDYKENLLVSGEEWDEEGEDLKNRFPLLWRKYSQD